MDKLKIVGGRSATCTLDAKTEKSNTNPSSISPFSIYNTLALQQQVSEDSCSSQEESKSSVDGENEWDAMESRIFSYLSDNKIEVMDLQDELRH